MMQGKQILGGDFRSRTLSSAPPPRCKAHLRPVSHLHHPLRAAPADVCRLLERVKNAPHSATSPPYAGRLLQGCGERGHEGHDEGSAAPS